MPAVRPPKRVHLPSGLVVVLEAEGGSRRSRARPRARRSSPSSSALVASGDLALRTDRGTLDLPSLELRDFHALRAIATRLGWLEEEAVEIACRNCGESFEHAPVRGARAGPLRRRGARRPGARSQRSISRSRTRSLPSSFAAASTARDVKLRPVTAPRPLRSTAPSAAGASSCPSASSAPWGSMPSAAVRDARRIADALARCPEEAWGAVGDLFLLAHYPPRLCVHRDMPEVRRAKRRGRSLRARARAVAPERRNQTRKSSPISTPSMRPRAQPTSAIVGPRQAAGAPRRRLGCPGLRRRRRAAPRRVRAARRRPDGARRRRRDHRCITGRSARCGRRTGPTTGPAELDETIEHELEHHDGWRVGHDPMDDEERAEIARERGAPGRKEDRRPRERRGAGRSTCAGFLAKTWPIWLIVAAATLAITVCGKLGRTHFDTVSGGRYRRRRSRTEARRSHGEDEQDREQAA